MMAQDARQRSRWPGEARLYGRHMLEAIGLEGGGVGWLAIEWEGFGEALARGGVEVVAVPVREQDQLDPGQDVINGKRQIGDGIARASTIGGKRKAVGEERVGEDALSRIVPEHRRVAYQAQAHGVPPSGVAGVAGVQMPH